MQVPIYGSKSWHWCWLPPAVLLTGIVSVVLLLWVHQISERLRVNSSLIDAVMDIQINTATYHLRLEEALHGYASSNAPAKEASASLNQAINLTDVILKGGQAEHDWISIPLKNQPLRARVEAIKSLLVKLKTIGEERLQDPEKAQGGSALERQFEGVYIEVLGMTRNLEDILESEEVKNQQKSMRLFRSILAIWTLLVAAATAGLLRREGQRKKAEEKLFKANELLLSQAEVLKEHSGSLEGLVEKRTAELTSANELLRDEIAERKRTEETLKESETRTEQLASELINAQEIERRRIAMELHDELGQALNATKLHLRIIEKGLEHDQMTIREECEKLLEYMDHVIEDVRRLSLDLSPTVLKDLGLTAAIQWLVSGFAKDPAVDVTADIEEIDGCIPEKHRITVYRVLQEILTNIRKHAQARHVSLAITRRDDSVSFAVEDDGAGFDPDEEMMKFASDRGFGLTTMSERVRMAGGILNLRSQTGKGTRISFSIPVEKEGA